MRLVGLALFAPGGGRSGLRFDDLRAQVVGRRQCSYGYRGDPRNQRMEPRAGPAPEQNARRCSDEDD